MCHSPRRQGTQVTCLSYSLSISTLIDNTCPKNPFRLSSLALPAC